MNENMDELKKRLDYRVKCVAGEIEFNKKLKKDTVDSCDKRIVELESELIDIIAQLTTYTGLSIGESLKSVLKYVDEDKPSIQFYPDGRIVISGTITITGSEDK